MKFLRHHHPACCSQYGGAHIRRKIPAQYAMRAGRSQDPLASQSLTSDSTPNGLRGGQHLLAHAVSKEPRLGMYQQIIALCDLGIKTVQSRRQVVDRKGVRQHQWPPGTWFAFASAAGKPAKTATRSPNSSN